MFYFNENEEEIMLAKPLRWIQIVHTGNGNIFRIEACYKNGSYRTAAFLDRTTDEECYKYQLFKSHYLRLNKLKYGDLCHYELDHCGGM